MTRISRSPQKLGRAAGSTDGGSHDDTSLADFTLVKWNTSFVIQGAISGLGSTAYAQTGSQRHGRLLTGIGPGKQPLCRWKSDR